MTTQSSNSENSQQHEAVSPFMIALEEFVFSVDSLFEGYPLTIALLGSTLRNARRDFEAFIEPLTTRVYENENGKEGRTFQVPVEKSAEFTRLRDSLRKREHALKSTRRSTIITMVGQFDSYIGDLSRSLFYEKVEIIDASERPISFADLVAFKTLDEARESIVEKEVDGILRGSHISQVEWFEKKLKVKILEHCSLAKTFVEVTERRNLFVHTGGKVSRQYLKNCADVPAVAAQSLKLGDVLTVSRDYVRDAHEALIEVGVKSGLIVWRKIREDDKGEAHQFLNRIAFMFLSEKKYQLAQRLLAFALGPFGKGMNNETRKMFVINLAQCYKWLGDTSKMREVLDAEDWSGSDETFKLVRFVLEDKTEELFIAIRFVHRLETLTAQEYREWPIFQQLRKDPQFQDLFVELFGEPLTATSETSQVVLESSRSAFGLAPEQLNIEPRRPDLLSS